SDVRKRLLQHYGTTGADSNMRISLPSGSYVPEFCFISGPPLQALDAPQVVRPVIDEPIALGTVVSPRAPWWSRPRSALAAPIALVLITAAIAGRHALNAAANENLVVAAFRGTPRTAQVVVADDALVLIQVLLDRRFTLEEYENLAYLNMPELIPKKELQRF